MATYCCDAANSFATCWFITSGKRGTARLYPRLVRVRDPDRTVSTSPTNLPGTLMAHSRMPEETDLHELVAAYALNALDEEDRAAFEEHLAGCEQCTVALADLRDTAAALAFVPETVAPPAALRSRILETARAERPNVVPLHRAARRTWGLGAVAAVAVAAAVALAIWNVSLHDSLDRQNAVQLHKLNGAQGNLAVADTGTAALFVCGLGDAPSGKTYEAWV